MYAALWRILPGPGWLRVLLLVLAALLLVAALFTWVFPWVDGLMVEPSVVGARTP
jgi:hypothetical protein